MIIILEGPDGSGKTSLAEKLSKQTGYNILHRSKPKSEEEKARMMDDYLLMAQTCSNVILDRCWYSEMVYGKVMRDKSVISSPQMYVLEEELAKTGAIIIYCTGPKGVLWTRCTERGEDYITSKEDFDSICDEYDKLMSDFHYIPVVKYEYKGM